MMKMIFVNGETIDGFITEKIQADLMPEDEKYRAYDYDADHIRQYVSASKTPEGFQEYLDKYVHGVKDHWAYLDLVGGMKHLTGLAADPILGY